jgi:hypothetical protein
VLTCDGRLVDASHLALAAFISGLLARASSSRDLRLVLSSAKTLTLVKNIIKINATMVFIFGPLVESFLPIF